MYTHIYFIYLERHLRLRCLPLLCRLQHLPQPQGLRAIGQKSMPALPHVMVDADQRAHTAAFALGVMRLRQSPSAHSCMLAQNGK